MLIFVHVKCLPYSLQPRLKYGAYCHDPAVLASCNWRIILFITSTTIRVRVCVGTWWGVVIGWSRANEGFWTGSQDVPRPMAECHSARRVYLGVSEVDTDAVWWRPATLTHQTLVFQVLDLRNFFGCPICPIPSGLPPVGGHGLWPFKLNSFFISTAELLFVYISVTSFGGVTSLNPVVPRNFLILK